MIGMFGEHCVVPHLFELIELSCFGLHNMYHYVHVIDEHPLQMLIAFVFIRVFAAKLLYLILYILADRPDLCVAGCLADHKEISYSFRYFPEVERNNVFAFFILYCFYDGFENP